MLSQKELVHQAALEITEGVYHEYQRESAKAYTTYQRAQEKAVHKALTRVAEELGTVLLKVPQRVREESGEASAGTGS